MAVSRIAIAFVVIVIAALAVKFAYLHERRTWPDFTHPTMDARIHDEWANALATGKWEGEIATFRSIPYYRAPLYPYLVSVIYRVFGRDYFLLVALQALAGAASVLLLARVARRLYGTGAALATAALAIGYWPLTYNDGELLNPTLSILLNLLFLHALLDAADRNRPARWLLPGALLGLSALTMPLGLAMLAPAVLWILLRGRGSGRPAVARTVAALVLGLVLCIAPVTLRNLIVGHDVVPIASSAGVNFYIGNNPGSNGIRAVVPGTRADWWGGYDDTRSIAETSAGHPLKASEVSRYWMRRGFQLWRDDPGHAVGLFARKLVLAFGNPEPSNNRQVVFQRRQSRVLTALPVNLSLILGLFGAGVVSLLRHRDRERAALAALASHGLPALLGVVYLVAVAAFFVTSRYRLPAVVFLIPLAGLGVERIVAGVRVRAWRGTVGSIAIVVVIYALTAQNPYAVGSLADSRGYYDIGVDYAMADPALALDSFDRSLMADSTYAPAWRMKGRTLEDLNRLDDACSALREACRLDTTSAESFFVLGRVLQKLGRDDAALASYGTAVRLDPTNKFAWNNMADILMRRGNVEEAVPLLESALAVDPEFPNARFGMAYYYERTGQVERALAIYRELRDFEPARARLKRLTGK